MASRLPCRSSPDSVDSSSSTPVTLQNGLHFGPLGAGIAGAFVLVMVIQALAAAAVMVLARTLPIRAADR